MMVQKLVASIAMIALALGAAAQQRLAPAPVASFDGQSWAGIKLGVDRDKDIKKRFQTSKGAIRPEALKLLTVKDSGYRVDLLLDGRGDNAVVRSIRLGFPDAPLSLNALDEDIEEQAQTYYAMGRTEDWRLVAFPNSGILTVVMGEGELAGILVAYLVEKESVTKILREYRSEPTPIEPVRDPGERWDRVVRYDDVDVSIRIDPTRKPAGLNSSWVSELEDDLERDGRYYRRGGILEYDSDEDGTLSIRVDTSDFSTEGKSRFSVNLTLTARTPYGQFSWSASQSRTLSSRFNSGTRELLEEALDDLSDAVRTKVRSLGPPPVEQHRERVLERLMRLATGAG